MHAYCLVLSEEDRAIVTENSRPIIRRKYSIVKILNKVVA